MSVRRGRARAGPWMLLLGSALLGSALLGVAGCGAPSGVPRRVLIPTGATLRSAADSLARAGVIDAPRLFQLYAHPSATIATSSPGPTCSNVTWVGEQPSMR